MTSFNSKLSMNDFLVDPRYTAWRDRIKRSGTVLKHVDVLATVQRDSKTFAGLVDSELITKDGHQLHRCMMIRGDSVLVVPVIYSHDGSQPYTIMVEQHRPVDGCSTLEFVGGMLEPDEVPEARAVHEVQEELGLTIQAHQLRLLHPEPIRVCTAMLDERAYFYMFALAVAKTFRGEIDGTKTGDHSDGEWIRIRTIDFPKVGAEPVFSAQVGVRLIENMLGYRFWEKVKIAAR